ncbi:hypothetical protein Dimus_018894, partial [Dionaea muscipula]
PIHSISKKLNRWPTINLAQSATCIRNPQSSNCNSQREFDGIQQQFMRPINYIAQLAAAQFNQQRGSLTLTQQAAACSPANL